MIEPVGPVQPSGAPHEKLQDNKMEKIQDWQLNMFASLGKKKAKQGDTSFDLFIETLKVRAAGGDKKNMDDMIKQLMGSKMAEMGGMKGLITAVFLNIPTDAKSQDASVQIFDNFSHHVGHQLSISSADMKPIEKRVDGLFDKIEANTHPSNEIYRELHGLIRDFNKLVPAKEQFPNVPAALIEHPKS